MNLSRQRRVILKFETSNKQVHREMRVCQGASHPTGSKRRRFAARFGITAAILLFAACGSDADSGPTAEPTEVGIAADEQGNTPPVSDAPGNASATEVADCLADAGYPTTLNSELLTEQQRMDLESVFGQVDGLTFADVSTFAGGVSFFTTPEQAAERADQLRDASAETRLSGSVLIHVQAGTGYEAHVDAAEECLT